jgi:ABC-type uncharacterized transport system auxiliary subunit
VKKTSVRNFVLAFLALAVLASGCLSRPALVRQDFLLQTPPLVRPATSPVGNVLVLSCDISPPFAGQSLVYRIGPDAFETDPYAGFLVLPNETLTIFIHTWLARSSLFVNIVEPGSPAPAGETLQVHVDEIYGDLRVPGRPQVVLSLSLLLFDAKTGKNGHVLFQKAYSRHLPVDQNTAAAIVAGWNRALDEIMGDFASDLEHLKKT